MQSVFVYTCRRLIDLTLIAEINEPETGNAVSFQWKNPYFLLKNPDFPLKNPEFITKQHGTAKGNLSYPLAGAWDLIRIGLGLIRIGLGHDLRGAV